MTREERELALYCLKASSDYHSEVCEECIKYPNCDHMGQDDVAETIIKALEQEPCNDAISRQAALGCCRNEWEEDVEEQLQSLPPVTPHPKTGHWINLEELEEGISRGCEYAGTQEVVHDTFLECLNELGCAGDWDEMSTIDLNDREIVLQDLVERFYDKTAKNIINYAKTCEASE